MPEIEASFLHPFSYGPLGEEGHISANLCFGGFISRQPPPAIFETSDNSTSHQSPESATTVK